MQGPEEHYALCEEVARDDLQAGDARPPLHGRADRDPGAGAVGDGRRHLSLALREAADEAVRRGVPREAAIDFMLGHLNIELAIAFDLPGGGSPTVP